MKKILPKTSKNPLGFTLIELLIVISIIAILAAIGMTIFGNVQKNARDAKRRGDIKAIQMALEQYKLANGSYPISPVGNWFGSCTVATIAACTGGTAWITGLSSYFSSGAVPNDPINNGFFAENPVPNPPHYGYSYYSGALGGLTAGSWYMLVVPLENPTSADLATNCTAGTIRYNYGAGAPNFPTGYANSVYANNTVMACNQQ